MQSRDGSETISWVTVKRVARRGEGAALRRSPRAPRLGPRRPGGRASRLPAAVDRFQRDKSDPSVIVFSVIKRCQLPHSTQFFQEAKKRPDEGRYLLPRGLGQRDCPFRDLWRLDDFPEEK